MQLIKRMTYGLAFRIPICPSSTSLRMLQMPATVHLATRPVALRPQHELKVVCEPSVLAIRIAVPTVAGFGDLLKQGLGDGALP